MTKLVDYVDKYENIRFERRDGVLLLRLHTKDGPFVFSDGASFQSNVGNVHE